MHNVQSNQLLFSGHQARVVSNDWTVGHRTGLFCLLSTQWSVSSQVMNERCEICIKSDCQWNLRATKSTTSAKRNFFISSASLWSCWRWWKWKWFGNICHCYYSEVILQHLSLLWKWKWLLLFNRLQTVSRPVSRGWGVSSSMSCRYWMMMMRWWSLSAVKMRWWSSPAASWKSIDLIKTATRPLLPRTPDVNSLRVKSPPSTWGTSWRLHPPTIFTKIPPSLWKRKGELFFQEVKKYLLECIQIFSFEPPCLQVDFCKLKNGCLQIHINVRTPISVLCNVDADFFLNFRRVG